MSPWLFWLCSGLTVGAILLGAGSAFLIGFSKTGIPGAGMPAITLMANAFREETKLSVGAMVPLLILGDLFGVLFFRRHANWPRLLEVLPYIVLGMVPGYVVLQRMDSETLRSLIGILILVLVSVHVACQPTRLGGSARSQVVYRIDGTVGRIRDRRRQRGRSCHEHLPAE